MSERAPDAAPLLLHVFATFAAGGPQVRTARLIAGLGRGWRHAILAMDGCTDARALLPGESAGVEARVLASPPRAGSLRTVRALGGVIAAEAPDLVLSYNWGAIEAALAARLARRAPLVHHEDGFRPDEQAGFKRRRELARRVLLWGAAAVVVPSRTLERIALERWRLPRARVRLIANGIRTEDFGAERDPAARAELGIPPDALVVGSVGHLRAEKRPVRLVEALAALAGGPPVHLLLLGDGPERDAVLEAARRLGVAERVHLAGHRAETAPWYAAMDVFALSSDTEQMPVALLEAMASGLPVAATDVGDVRCVLPAEQRDFVVPLAGAATGRALATALERLSRAPELRARLGAENRARVGERYSFDAMLAAYAGLYRSLLPAAKAPLAPA